MRINPQLQERLITLVSSMGYEWIGCEQANQGRLNVLRLYIDSPKGVTADVCSEVSRQVGAVLDVEAPYLGSYVLEISSPGIERPLFTLAHYRQYVGSKVRIKLALPINQRRQYKGLIERVDEENVYVQVEGTAEAQKLPFSAIERANLIVDLSI